MRDSLVDQGEAEVFKGIIHLLLLSLVSMCLGYNLMALLSRRELRLLLNTLVYLGVFGFEFVQIQEHLRTALEGRTPPPVWEICHCASCESMRSLEEEEG